MGTWLHEAEYFPLESQLPESRTLRKSERLTPL
jgi:hypothetical protein